MEAGTSRLWVRISEALFFKLYKKVMSDSSPTVNRTCYAPKTCLANDLPLRSTQIVILDGFVKSIVQMIFGLVEFGDSEAWIETTTETPKETVKEKGKREQSGDCDDHAIIGRFRDFLGEACKV